MSLTPEQLRDAACCSTSRAISWAPHINAALDRYGIDTPLRIAAWLAQISHESAQLCRTVEIWGPTDAQRRYEGRADLGNVRAGDGERFKGRGLIQITGRANYAAYSRSAGIDFTALPEQLAQPTHAALSAGWYWRERGLNALADARDMVQITRRINGGENGLRARLDIYRVACQTLGVR